MKKLSRDEMKKINGGVSPCVKACLDTLRACWAACSPMKPSCYDACEDANTVCQDAC